MSKPVAVIVSDVHYSLSTLEIADACMHMAIDKANELNVPLVVAGDLHDTKANMRAECVNRMIDTFKYCYIKPYVLVGNHCKTNERSAEHALHFLQELVIIVDEPMDLPRTGAHGIPYHHDVEELRAYLKTIPQGSTLIMHQGLNGSDSGEYIQDHSALNPEDVQDFRVISGHYHRRQDIKTGRPRKGAVGLWSYIGNPYTLNFGEADHPEKGFQILMDDGTLEFVPTNQRKHVTLDLTLLEAKFSAQINPGDLVRVRVKGPKDWLNSCTKEVLKNRFPQLPDTFKLEHTVEDHETEVVQYNAHIQPNELFDQIIDQANIAQDTKNRLKSLWKSLKGCSDAGSQGSGI